jgi:hypothetical protein
LPLKYASTEGNFLQIDLRAVKQGGPKEGSSARPVLRAQGWLRRGEEFFRRQAVHAIALKCDTCLGIFHRNTAPFQESMCSA